MENTIIQNFSGAVLEGMTSVSALIGAIENGKNTRKIHKILFDSSKLLSKKREFSFLTARAEALGFDLSVASEDEISRYATGNSHGGVIALCGDRELPELEASSIKKDGVYYIFEGIEDPYNFGYMIRSVYAAGADGIIVSKRNWLSAASVVARASAGTSELIDTFVAEPSDAVDILHSLGYSVVCAGIRDSKTIYEADIQKPVLLIVGGEKRGISRSLLDKADQIVRIDYARSFRGSLPSVAATAIIAFEVMRKVQ